MCEMVEDRRLLARVGSSAAHLSRRIPALLHRLLLLLARLNANCMAVDNDGYRRCTGAAVRPRLC